MITGRTVRAPPHPTAITTRTVETTTTAGTNQQNAPTTATARAPTTEMATTDSADPALGSVKRKDSATRSRDRSGTHKRSASQDSNTYIKSTTSSADAKRSKLHHSSSTTPPPVMPAGGVTPEHPELRFTELPTLMQAPLLASVTNNEFYANMPLLEVTTKAHNLFTQTKQLSHQNFLPKESVIATAHFLSHTGLQHQHMLGVAALS
jgi:hypothetical protein